MIDESEVVGDSEMLPYHCEGCGVLRGLRSSRHHDQGLRDSTKIRIMDTRGASQHDIPEGGLTPVQSSLQQTSVNPQRCQDPRSSSRHNDVSLVPFGEKFT